MVSGDVFRPPKNAMLLCVQLGSGVQIITSSFATLLFAALGEACKLYTMAACLYQCSAPVLTWFRVLTIRGASCPQLSLAAAASTA